MSGSSGGGAPDRVERSRVLEALLAEALEARERGEPVDVAALCREHPDLAPAVAAAFGRAVHLPRMHRDASRIDAALGAVLGGRYRLEERVGAGAMGVVYRARDVALGRAVAVKLLRPELVAGARMDARLAREGEVLASIRHPGVVTVHDRGQADDGRAFLVMELLQGCSIAQLLRDDAEASGAAIRASERIARFRRFVGADVAFADNDVRQAAAWVAAAAAGLHAAHCAGVVHRDVKPSNLFVDRGGRLVVLDFGIVSSASHATLGSDGSPLGTPAYMAPEQLDPDAEPNPRGDVYGLAATLYHMVTGQPPFGGSVQQVLATIGRRDPERADRVRPGLPGDLVAIIEKGMAREPERRYPTAAALREDLLAWLDYRPVAARRASWLSATWRRARRSAHVRTAAAVLLVVGLAAAGWQWSVERAQQREAEWGALWAQVPPVLINELPRYRATSGVRTSPRVAALLDRMVALDGGPGVSLAVRAMHRADGGDFAGAAADLQQIVDAGEAPFAALAAAAYRNGERPDAAAQGAAPPVAGGPADRFVVALHALRCAAASPTWVDELLARDDGLARFPGFAELQLVLQMNRAVEVPAADEQFRRFRDLERDVERLTVARGGRSAIASQVLVNAYLHQGRLAEARDVTARATELAPDDYVLWQLRGWVAHRSGDGDGAIVALERAMALQPASVHVHVILSDALIGCGRFDEAEAVLAAGPFDAAPDGAVKRAQQQGLLWYARASVAFAAAHAAGGASSDAPPYAEYARRARDAFAEARIAAGAGRGLEEMLCDRMLGEPHTFVEMFELLQERPLEAELLSQVSWFLPESLRHDEIDALARFLRMQAMLLDGRDR